mgnify:CR=1 FL=1
MSRTSYPAPPLPRAGQLRAWWRAPASTSALAWHVARAAQAHGKPLLLVARDNHGAQQIVVGNVVRVDQMHHDFGVGV